MALADQAAEARLGKTRSLRRREELNGWLFASPWILGFLIFTLGPMIASLYLSFTKYTVGQEAEWLGLANYVRALSGKDDLFWPSMGRTIRYAVVMVPVGISLSLLAALALNQKLRGTVFFRTFFFLPSLTPVVASAILWRWLYQPEFGAINWLLWEVGIQGPKWLGSPDVAMPSLMIIGLWGSIGGGTMIIFLAGLQGVPQELQEAAEIDGARAWQRFLQRDRADDHANDLLQPGHRHHCRAEGLRRVDGRDRWRPELRNLVLHPPPLLQRLPVLRHGLRLGAGLDLLRAGGHPHRRQRS